MAELKLSKGLQGARDAGVGAAAASLVASILCIIFPETPEGPGLDYATTFTACLVIAGGASRAFFNWRKHRRAERQGYVKILVLAILPTLFLGSCAMTQEIEDPIEFARGTKAAGELAYSIVYLAHQAGSISDDEHAAAELAYNIYVATQTAFVHSIPLMEGETREDLEYLMPRTLAEIQADFARAPPVVQEGG